MWDWINCRLLGRHEYAVWCQGGNVYLRCLRCGGRSNGWEVTANPTDVPATARARRVKTGRNVRLVSRPSA